MRPNLLTEDDVSAVAHCSTCDLQEFFLSEFGQDIKIDIILGKQIHILSKADVFQPIGNVGHFICASSGPSWHILPQ